MAAFPSYDAAAVAALDAQANAMLAAFARARYARVEPPILQPADVFLDRSGEEIRRRTFLFSDAQGNELCLRPELTIPVCRAHLESRGKFPARLAYHGPAFRAPQSTRQRPNQFLQTGVECLGVENREAADDEVLSLAVKALRASGLKSFSLRLGDVALFNRLIDRLNIPAQWQARLKRHFWRRDYFTELLDRLAGVRAPSSSSAFAEIAAAGEAGAREAAERLMDGLGAAPLGNRSREEIVERLIEQAAEANATQLDAKAIALIDAVLSVAGPVQRSLDRIAHLANDAGVDLDAPLAALERRAKTLKSLKLGDAEVSFAARFGRNMEYYTGLVFEFWARDAEGPVQVAGGGRYDTLLKALGSAKAIPAVGCAIRGERVLAAKAKARGGRGAR